MRERRDVRCADWPLRPWVMAAICAVAGLFFELLVDFSINTPVSALRQASATFVAVGAVSLVITVERRRWLWSLWFALGWGMVVALVGWSTAGYNQQLNIFELPFFAGVTAVLLAAPLFQAVRDEGAWRMPYPRVFAHALTDAIIGAASLAFVGVTFLLAWLIAGLFDVIGISVVKDLLRQPWFGWMLAGFAFGSAVGLLRERDQLVPTLQRLLMLVLSVLAPVLALALGLFLLSLPFTGLGGLWDSSVPATPLMLAAAVGAILLANAVIGDGEDGHIANPVLRLSAMALVLTVFPLAIIAAMSLAQRIGQYGWTPERIWGVVAVGVAGAYGAIGWWAVAKRRARFDEALRPLQTMLAVGLCGLAVLLALPIVDFGAISARSQMARLADGQTTADQFDWRAMAFDFGPAGRQRLAAIARGGPVPQRKLAAAALGSKNRHDVNLEVTARRSEETLDSRVRLVPENATLSPDLRRAIALTSVCRTARCIVALAAEDRVIVAGRPAAKGPLLTETLVREEKGRWSIANSPLHQTRAPTADSVDLDTGRVEIRTVERRILTIDGRQVGEAFE